MRFEQTLQLPQHRVAFRRSREHPMPTPLALTDQQLDAVLRAAEPLLPRDRGPFLEEVARALATLPDIGDGIVHRRSPIHKSALLIRRVWST
jgi:hypothetical protein